MTIDKMMMMMMTGGKNRIGKGAALKVRTHRRLPRRERWKHKLSLLYLDFQRITLIKQRDIQYKL